MKTSVEDLISNGLGFVVFIVLAYLLVPLALQFIRRLLEPYDDNTKRTLLLEKYFVIALWTGAIVVGLGKLSFLIPGLGRVLNLLRPAWLSAMEVLDLLKWVAVCACILLVGGIVKNRD